MKAVVVAGGEGTRIRPLTLQRPKPLVPLVNRPILAHLVRQLRTYGVTELRLTLRHMAALIQDFFQLNPYDDIHVSYVVEEFPLGTAGNLKTAVQDWTAPFLVVSGDGLTDLDFRRLYEAHLASGAEVTINLHREEETHDFGVVLTNEHHEVYDFVEKPRPSEQKSDTVNTGIYVINPSVLDLVPDNQEFDFSLDLFPAMLRQGRRIHGHVMDGYWCDVGNTDTYLQASQDILRGKVGLQDPLGTEIAPGIWAGDNVSIHPEAILRGPLYIGHEVQIGPSTVIEGPTVIRQFTRVEPHAHVEHSVVWRNSYLGPSSQVSGAIIGRQCSVGAHAIVSEECVVGDGCVLEEGAILMPHVRLWPHKRILRRSTVRESIIQGKQGRRDLFRGYTISGQTNLDLTSEIAARIGVALGSCLAKGSRVAVNRDVHRASRMIKRALISGLVATGVDILDLGNVAMPVLRHFVRGHAAGGAHVRVNPDDPHPQTLAVQILEQDGSNLGKAMERKVEAGYFQENFRRVGMDDLGSITYVPNVLEAYTTDFLSKVFEMPLRQEPFKLAVDYANGLAADVMSRLFSQFQIETVPLNSLVEEDRLFVDQAMRASKHEELAQIVTAVGAHLGVMFDVTGEIIRLVDDQGTILNPWQADALFLEAALYNHPHSRVVFPDHMPRAYTAIARRYGATVMHSKSDMHNLMAMAASGDVLVALNGKGNFIFPFFHPAPDPMMATFKLLEYLAVREESASQILASLPPLNCMQTAVEVPWAQKTAVMSQLNLHHQADLIDSLEGLKIRTGDKEWVYLQPSSVDPAIEITVDTPTRFRSRVLVEKFRRTVSQLVPPEENRNS